MCEGLHGRPTTALLQLMEVWLRGDNSCLHKAPRTLMSFSTPPPQLLWSSIPHLSGTTLLFKTQKTHFFRTSLPVAWPCQETRCLELKQGQWPHSTEPGPFRRCQPNMTGSDLEFSEPNTTEQNSTLSSLLLIAGSSRLPLRFRLEKLIALVKHEGWNYTGGMERNFLSFIDNGRVHCSIRMFSFSGGRNPLTAHIGLCSVFGWSFGGRGEVSRLA